MDVIEPVKKEEVVTETENVTKQIMAELFEDAEKRSEKYAEEVLLAALSESACKIHNPFLRWLNKSIFYSAPDNFVTPQQKRG